MEQFLKKIEDRAACVAVIGLGYVGLPLAVEFAKAGFRVIGIDVDAVRVGRLKRGESYIKDIPSVDLQKIIADGRFVATTALSFLAEADACCICVPTPLGKTKDPDVSFILQAARAVKSSLRRGQLIVLESTTYPGTTRELVLPMLEEDGLKVGVDFGLAFSPERIDPGNSTYGLKNTPRVVGGITPACTQMAVALYSQIVARVMPVSSVEAAEMTKLLENTFRIVNIGLVNEIAIMCDRLGINVWEVVEAASTKPYGFIPFYPGPGLGGHCIPVDPHYLSWKLRTLNYRARFIELAGEINAEMPEYVVGKIADALNRAKKSVNGSSVLILGVAYKRDIDDVRESPALDIIKLLCNKGAEVTWHDPYVRELKGMESLTRAAAVTSELLSQADCVVITTDHSTYDWEAIVKDANLIVDSRNATRQVGLGRHKIVPL
ncbi:MAG: nucleotide sugar dehydrogenase [Nitrospirae bacterium]|nr:MAG: nucleotide sugar dehydrogenase [Nitrospirota bacterium]